MNVIMFTIQNKISKEFSFAFAKTKDRSRSIWVFIEPKEGFQDPIFQELSASEFDECYDAIMFQEVNLMQIFKEKGILKNL